MRGVANGTGVKCIGNYIFMPKEGCQIGASEKQNAVLMSDRSKNPALPASPSSAQHGGGAQIGRDWVFKPSRVAENRYRDPM